MTRVGRRLASTGVARWTLAFLDNWRPWVAVLMAGFIAINIWTLTIDQSQAHDETARKAEHIANAEAQYHACVRSIPILTKINLFITGIATVETAQVANARAVIAATSPDATELLRVRKANLARLQIALAAADNVEFTVPTKTSCAALLERLLQTGSEGAQSVGSSVSTSSVPS